MSSVSFSVDREATARPLCVDLDGTLVRSDLLIEAIFVLLKQNLFMLFNLFRWLRRGKAHFKQQIAERVDIDPTLLPYHQPFLEYLREEHRKGRRLILATASNQKYAEAVALHLGIFEEVLASDAQTNLSGTRKLMRLQEAFGENGFDYAGNAMVDLAIWRHAGEAIVVNADSRVRAAAERVAQVGTVFEDRESILEPYLTALRPHQWVKNTLVFIPLILAHEFDELAPLFQTGVAFLAFSLCASSVYLLNDLLDLSADRQHRHKSHRPFASGSLSLVHGVLLIPTMLVGAFAIALYLPIEFLGVLAIYYLTTLTYSLRLKRSPIVDVLALAGLYTLRLIAGAAAITVTLSFWLLAFSMFLFLSLALVKRYTEVLGLRNEGRAEAPGRGYLTVDLETLAHFGTASAYMSVLVLALYINSEKVKELYTHPEVIWLLCPIMLYLVSRIWLLARRDQLHEDPVVFALKDRASQYPLLAGAALLWLAI